jgi:flagellar hook assembly protein FlgD
VVGKLPAQPAQAGDGKKMLNLVPDRFELFANTPNPVNQQTMIRYAIPTSSSPISVDLGIYDLAGRLVRDIDSGPRGQGVHAVGWDGHDGNGNPVPSGLYFYRIVAGQFVARRRLIVAR